MLRSFHKRSLTGGLFACAMGVVLVSLAISWIVQQKFRFGRGSSALVTPESHPVFFWTWLLGQIAVGCFIVFRGVVDVRDSLRERKQHRQRIETI